MTEQLIVWDDIIDNARAIADAGFTALAGVDGLEEYSSVKAFGLVPTPRVKRFVRFLRTGGGQVDLVTLQPNIVAESWGSSDQDAEKIADILHAIMLRAGRAGWFGTMPLRRMGVLSAPQRLPDPVSGQHRYSAMYAPQLRGRVVA